MLGFESAPCHWEYFYEQEMVVWLLSVALAPETTKSASSLVTALALSHVTPDRRKKTMIMCHDLSLKLGS